MSYSGPGFVNRRQRTAVKNLPGVGGVASSFLSAYNADQRRELQAQAREYQKQAKAAARQNAAQFVKDYGAFTRGGQMKDGTVMGFNNVAVDAQASAYSMPLSRGIPMPFDSVMQGGESYGEWLQRKAQQLWGGKQALAFLKFDSEMIRSVAAASGIAVDMIANPTEAFANWTKKKPDWTQHLGLATARGRTFHYYSATGEKYVQDPMVYVTLPGSPAAVAAATISIRLTFYTRESRGQAIQREVLADFGRMYVQQPDSKYIKGFRGATGKKNDVWLPVCGGKVKAILAKLLGTTGSVKHRVNADPVIQRFLMAIAYTGHPPSGALANNTCSVPVVPSLAHVSSSQALLGLQLFDVGHNPGRYMINGVAADTLPVETLTQLLEEKIRLGKAGPTISFKEGYKLPFQRAGQSFTNSRTLVRTDEGLVPLGNADALRDSHAGYVCDNADMGKESGRIASRHGGSCGLRAISAQSRGNTAAGGYADYNAAAAAYGAHATQPAHLQAIFDARQAYKKMQAYAYAFLGVFGAVAYAKANNIPVDDDMIIQRGMILNAKHQLVSGQISFEVAIAQSGKLLAVLRDILGTAAVSPPSMAKGLAKALNYPLSELATREAQGADQQQVDAVVAAVKAVQRTIAVAVAAGPAADLLQADDDTNANLTAARQFMQAASMVRRQVGVDPLVDAASGSGSVGANTFPAVAPPPPGQTSQQFSSLQQEQGVGGSPSSPQ